MKDVSEDQERREALKVVEQWLETPMLVLGFVWLVLFILELVYGLNRILAGLGLEICVGVRAPLLAGSRQAFVPAQELADDHRLGHPCPSDSAHRPAPHQAVLHVTSAAFRTFKARHRLKTRRQFEAAHGPHAWTRAELCFAEHAQAQRLFETACGASAPIGIAIEYGLAIFGSRSRRPALGLLPIEAVVWARVFDGFLAQHGLDYEDWRELDVNGRRSLWVETADRNAATFAALLHAPAATRLADEAAQVAGEAAVTAS